MWASSYTMELLECSRMIGRRTSTSMSGTTRWSTRDREIGVDERVVEHDLAAVAVWDHRESSRSLPSRNSGQGWAGRAADEELVASSRPLARVASMTIHARSGSSLHDVDQAGVTS